MRIMSERLENKGLSGIFAMPSYNIVPFLLSCCMLCFVFSAAKEPAEDEGVAEQLKATDQMLWVQKMNDIRNRATEIVNAELIFTVKNSGKNFSLPPLFLVKEVEKVINQ